MQYQSNFKAFIFTHRYHNDRSKCPSLSSKLINRDKYPKKYQMEGHAAETNLCSIVGWTWSLVLFSFRVGQSNQSTGIRIQGVPCWTVGFQIKSKETSISSRHLTSPWVSRCMLASLFMCHVNPASWISMYWQTASQQIFCSRSWVPLPVSPLWFIHTFMLAC